MSANETSATDEPAPTTRVGDDRIQATGGAWINSPLVHGGPTDIPGSVEITTYRGTVDIVHALEDAARVAMTDGGVGAVEDLQYDPRAFDSSLTPAVVDEVHEDDSVSKVSFANVQLRDCGALYWVEWSGATGLLPQWRWSEVRYLGTERVEPDGTRLQARIAADDWGRLPDVVRELVDQDDDAEESTLVADSGHLPGHTPNTNAPNPEAETETSSPRPNGGEEIARIPEFPRFERDILLTLALSGPTAGRGLLDDLASLRDGDVSDARLYPHLNELVDAGLVEKRENYHDDRSHEFRLSNAGHYALREHAQHVTGAIDALEEGER